MRNAIVAELGNGRWGDAVGDGREVTFEVGAWSLLAARDQA